jgi:predicted deacetylase
MQTHDPIVEEDKKMRRLRVIVDLTAGVLTQERLSVDEALDLMNAARHTVLVLFPDKEETYDIIYGRRFARIVKERFGREDNLPSDGPRPAAGGREMPRC